MVVRMRNGLKQLVYETPCVDSDSRQALDLKQEDISLRCADIRPITEQENFKTIALNDNYINRTFDNEGVTETSKVHSVLKRCQRFSDNELSFVVFNELAGCTDLSSPKDIIAVRKGNLSNFLNNSMLDEELTVKNCDQVDSVNVRGTEYEHLVECLDVRENMEENATSSSNPTSPLATKPEGREPNDHQKAPTTVIDSDVTGTRSPFDEVRVTMEDPQEGTTPTSLQLELNKPLSPAELSKHHKRTVVVYPRPRIANINPAPSRKLVHQLLSTPSYHFRALVPNLPPKLIPCPTHMIHNRVTYQTSSPQEEIRYISEENSQMSNCEGIMNDSRALNIGRNTRPPPSSSSSGRGTIHSRKSTITSSAVELLLSRARQVTGQSFSIVTSESKTSHSTGDYISSCTHQNTAKSGRYFEYTMVNLSKGARVSRCHTQPIASSRVYHNLPPHIGHLCAFHDSGSIPALRKPPQNIHFYFSRVNHSPEMIEVKVLQNNRISHRPIEMSTTAAIDNNPHTGSNSPPTLETMVEENVKLSENRAILQQELQSESNTSRENNNDILAQQEAARTVFPTLERYLRLPEEPARQILAWNTERMLENASEIHQTTRNDLFENISECTPETSTDNNSNDDTSPDTDLEEDNYDSDASIDVGDSYDPDPQLTAMELDIEGDNDAFYDGFEDDSEEGSERLSKPYSGGSSRQDLDLCLSDYSMGAVITSSPIENDLQQEETTSEKVNELKRRAGGDHGGASKQRYVVVERSGGTISSESEWKRISVFQGGSFSEGNATRASNESLSEGSSSKNLDLKTFASDEEVSNQGKAKGGGKSVKSRGVYRELGMRSNSGNMEDLGEFYPNTSVICKESSSIKLVNENQSKILIVGNTEIGDRDMLFSLSDTALRCRMLVVLWALLGEFRLRKVGFPQDPVHRILWRTVDVCCSVAGVKSAAAVPLASDHDCGRDMVCFRDHAHRFLEVCAPTREHWKRFGWASLTVDAVVRKIYVGEILPAIQYSLTTDIPDRVRHAMDMLVALEKASEQQKSRGRFILPKAPLPPETGTVPASVRASSGDLEPVKKKRGRPAKIANKSDVGRVERVMLWRFLLNLLEDPRNAPCIHWVRREEGIFRILNTDWLARLWGRRHGNPRMTYEKMARAMRTYYRSKVLQPVPRSPNLPRKLVYKFNPAVIQKVAAAKLAAMAVTSQVNNNNNNNDINKLTAKVENCAPSITPQVMSVTRDS